MGHTHTDAMLVALTALVAWGIPVVTAQHHHKLATGGSAATVTGQLTAATAPPFSGLTLALQFGGYRDINCSVGIAAAYRDDSSGAARRATGAAVVATLANVAAAPFATWTFPDIPNGWQILATLPGSALLPAATMLSLSAAGIPSAFVQVPGPAECIAQVDTPFIFLSRTASLPVGASFGPVSARISSIVAGSTILVTAAGRAETEYVSGSTITLDGCGAGDPIYARATKPGMLGSVSAYALALGNTAASGTVAICTSAAMHSTGVTPVGGSLALGGAGTGRDASGNVVVIVSYSNSQGPGTSVFALARTDSGGLHWNSTFAIVNGRDVTITAGQLRGTPTLQLFALSPGGAWVPSMGEAVTASAGRLRIAIAPSLVVQAAPPQTNGVAAVSVTITSGYPVYAEATTFVTTDGSDPRVVGGSRAWFAVANAAQLTLTFAPPPMWVVDGISSAVNCTTVRAYNAVAWYGDSDESVVVACIPNIAAQSSSSSVLASCGTEVVVLPPAGFVLPACVLSGSGCGTPQNRRAQIQSMFTCVDGPSSDGALVPLGDGSYYEDGAVFSCSNDTYLWDWGDTAHWDPSTEAGWTTAAGTELVNITVCAAAASGLVCWPGDCSSQYFVMVAGKGTATLQMAPPGFLCSCGALVASATAYCGPLTRCSSGSDAAVGAEIACAASSPPVAPLGACAAAAWASSTSWVSSTITIIRDVTLVFRAPPPSATPSSSRQPSLTATTTPALTPQSTGTRSSTSTVFIGTRTATASSSTKPSFTSTTSMSPSLSSSPTRSATGTTSSLHINTACNTVTGLACAMSAAELAWRWARATAGGSTPSPCTLSYSSCLVAGPPVVQPVATGTGCIGGVMVFPTDTLCHPGSVWPLSQSRRLGNATAVDGARVGDPISAGKGDSATVKSHGTDGHASRILQSDPRCRSAWDSIFCSTECRPTIARCAAGVYSESATPAGTLCVSTTADTMAGAALVTSSFPGCIPAGATRDTAGVEGTAKCYDASAAADALHGKCTSSYYVCKVLGGVPGPAVAVPIGTLCLDGHLVPESACSDVSTAAYVLHSLDVRGTTDNIDAATAAMLANAFATTVTSMCVHIGNATLSLCERPVTPAAVNVLVGWMANSTAQRRLAASLLQLPRSSVGRELADQLTSVKSPLLEYTPSELSLVGVPLLTALPQLGIGRTTLTISVAVPSLRAAKAVVSALESSVQIVAATGLSEVTAQLARSGSPLVVSVGANMAGAFIVAQSAAPSPAAAQPPQGVTTPTNLIIGLTFACIIACGCVVTIARSARARELITNAARLMVTVTSHVPGVAAVLRYRDAKVHRATSTIVDAHIEIEPAASATYANRMGEPSADVMLWQSEPLAMGANSNGSSVIV